MTQLWVTPDQLGEHANSDFADEACRTASHILWALSGRRYAGVIRVTEIYEFAQRMSESSPVRPELYNGQVYNRMLYSQQSHGTHQHLRLRGHPVRSIERVRISGAPTDLSPDSYWLENKAVLGYSGCFDSRDLEVTYTYGVPIPAAGRRAARQLATQFILSSEDSDDCTLPDSVTSVTRQGLTYQLLDNNTLVDDLKTGVYSIDLFLKSVNPDNARKPVRVFSPDLPSAKRITRRVPPAGSPVGLNDFILHTALPTSTWSVPINALLPGYLPSAQYEAHAQISSRSGQVVLSFGPNRVTVNNGYISCTLTQFEVQSISNIDFGSWDVYAIQTNDSSTFVRVLTSTLWIQP